MPENLADDAGPVFSSASPKPVTGSNDISPIELFVQSGVLDADKLSRGVAEYVTSSSYRNDLDSTLAMLAEYGVTEKSVMQSVGDWREPGKFTKLYDEIRAVQATRRRLRNTRRLQLATGLAVSLLFAYFQWYVASGWRRTEAQRAYLENSIEASKALTDYVADDVLKPSARLMYDAVCWRTPVERQRHAALLKATSQASLYYGDDAQAKARLLSLVGSFFLEIGSPIEAKELFLSANALFRSQLGNDHEITIQTTIDLANCYVATGEFSRAVELMRPFAKRYSAEPRDTGILLSCANTYASALFASGRVQEAAEVFSSQARATIRSESNRSATLVVTRANLDRICFVSGQEEEAVADIEAAIDEVRRLYGDASSPLLLTQIILAEMYIRSGDRWLDKLRDIEQQLRRSRLLSVDSSSTALPLFVEEARANIDLKLQNELDSVVNRLSAVSKQVDGIFGTQSIASIRVKANYFSALLAIDGEAHKRTGMREKSRMVECDHVALELKKVLEIGFAVGESEGVLRHQLGIYLMQNQQFDLAAEQLDRANGIFQSLQLNGFSIDTRTSRALCKWYSSDVEQQIDALLDLQKLHREVNIPTFRSWYVRDSYAYAIRNAIGQLTGQSANLANNYVQAWNRRHLDSLQQLREEFVRVMPTVDPRKRDMSLAIDAGNIARVLNDLGRWPDAEKLGKESLNELKGISRGDAWAVGLVRIEYGRAILRVRPADGKSEIEKGIQELDSATGIFVQAASIAKRRALTFFNN